MLSGVLIGLIGGAASGLLGVSPGGFLVALPVLMLGLPQHMAQGISLVAQVPPTSLAGVLRYRKSGHAVPLRWVVLLSLGFIAGSIVGAYGADAIAERTLRWMFVAYLAVLGVLATLRLRSSGEKKNREAGGDAAAVGAAALFGVGLVSGMSSGLLGIGGGLAITALLAAMRVPQHQSQSLALAVTTLPLTAPSAWVYASQERGLPWPIIAGILVGLIIGTEIGARLATFLTERTLRRLMVVCIFIMAAFMAWRTWNG